jgi:hypothetical protein
MVVTLLLSALTPAGATKVACEPSTPTTTVICEGWQAAECDSRPTGIEGRCLTPRGGSKEERAEFALGQILDLPAGGVDLSSASIRRIIADGRVALAGGGFRTFSLPDEAGEGTASGQSRLAREPNAGSPSKSYVCKACTAEGACHEGTGATRHDAVKEVTGKVNQICNGFPECLRSFMAGLHCEER